MIGDPRPPASRLRPRSGSYDPFGRAAGGSTGTVPIFAGRHTSRISRSSEVRISLWCMPPGIKHESPASSRQLLPSSNSSSTQPRWPCLVPTAAKSAASSALSVISAGNGQLNPALASRFNVNRTVDGATPTRRAISLSPIPAVQTKHFAHLAHCCPLCWHPLPRAKAKGADPNRASRGAA